MKVTTGSSIGAGTDAHVYIKIIGTEGTTTEHELVGPGDTFERGRFGICSFLFSIVSCVRMEIVNITV